jgi:hypothetical protein
MSEPAAHLHAFLQVVNHVGVECLQYYAVGLTV